MDGISLLKAIKSIVYNFQDQKYLAHSIHDAKHQFCLLSQGKQTTQAYLEQFQNVVDMIEHCGGSIGFEPGLHEEILSKKGIPRQVATTKQKDQVAKEARERYLGTAFLCGSDRAQYGGLLEKIKNDFVQGQDNYPKMLVAAYNLLTNWKQDPCNMVRMVGQINDGVAFTNVDDRVSGAALVTSDGTSKKGHGGDKSHITCHRCGVKGHFVNECDEYTKGDGDHNKKASDEAASTQWQRGKSRLITGVDSGEFSDGDHFDFQFQQSGHPSLDNRSVMLQIGESGTLPKNWILLDNQSTVDVFYNPKLLKNI